MSDKFYDAVKDAAERHTEAGWGDSTFNDASFIIEQGAEKLPNPTAGKQYMQKYRHLPHHTKTATDGLANGTVDVPHLRNALARVNQTKPIKEDTSGYQSRARSHLEKHAKALLKTYQKGSVQFAETETLCKEFNISLAENE